MAITRCAHVLSRCQTRAADLGAVEELVVGCLLEGRPQVGGWILITAGMTRKNAISSLHGPADNEGIVRVAGGDLIGWARSSVNIAIMDYGNPSSDWTGELFVKPVGLKSLSKAFAAYEQFHSFAPYPDGYLDGLAALRGQLEHAADVRLLVTIVDVKASKQVRVTSQPGPVLAAEA